MHARRHRTTRIIRRDSPEIAEAKPVRLRARLRDIVQIVTVFLEKLAELLSVHPPQLF